MADNAISVGGVPVRSKDRGNNVQAQVMLDGPALSATVLVAQIGTSSATPAFTADTATRRQVCLHNTGATLVEISSIANFAFGAGWQIAPGERWVMNYAGAIYARCSTGGTELRMWSED